MYCSGCGQALAPGQVVCSQCGRSMAPPVPPIPNLDFQLQNYAGRIRALSIVWYIWGGLSLVLGLAGLAFANAFLSHAFGAGGHGPWGEAPWGPQWFFPAVLHFAWIFVVSRSVLAFAAGWGLQNRAPWGRIVAIVAAFVNLIKIPIGTALGIWTLVTLMGYRNTTLYEQLP
jgi:hypothetical protein